MMRRKEKGLTTQPSIHVSIVGFDQPPIHVGLLCFTFLQVSPEDAMVTLDLSNGCSATVTSKQLRQNSGLERFPVAAKRVNARGAPTYIFI